MANPGQPDALYIEAMQALADENGNQSAAARRLGIKRETFRGRIARASQLGITAHGAPGDGPILPDFPADDIPIEKAIDQMCERFEMRRASHAAHTWFPIKFPDDQPIGIMWWGDPHLDDNGCNMPLIKRYAEICKTTEGLWSANIGDTTNNWIGRLVRLYADQDTSLKTARRLAKWFMHDAGINWLVWLLGNHNSWGDGADILAMMGKAGPNKIVCHEWEARFRLCFPNGREVKVHAAHNFKGHSLWHNMHGLVRQANLGEDTDLLVAGHLHTWGIHREELAGRGGTFPTMIRVRGFKHMDDHARNLGFSDEEEGGAVLTIIDPGAQSRSGLINVFTDIPQGIKVLNALRS